MAELNQQRTLKQLDEEDEFKLVEKRINALVSTSTKEELKKTIPIVLISTGSLSPIHLLHVRVLEIAKKELESQDSRIKVIGGFVSPSHDDYTSSKLGSEWIPSEDRLRSVLFFFFSVIIFLKCLSIFQSNKHKHSNF